MCLQAGDPGRQEAAATQQSRQAGCVREHTSSKSEAGGSGRQSRFAGRSARGELLLLRTNDNNCHNHASLHMLQIANKFVNTSDFIISCRI